MKELIVNAKGRDKRWALREDGMLQEFHTRQGTHQSKVGSVYYAVVEKVVSGLQAAFVNIGEDKRAFLSKDDVASFASCKDEKKHLKPISHYLHQGEKILVQVMKDETDSKGPKVTGLIEYKGLHMVYMPNGGYVAASKKITDEKRQALKEWAKTKLPAGDGLLFRTVAGHCDWSTLEEELNQLIQDSQLVEKQLVQTSAPALIKETDAFLNSLSSLFEKEWKAEDMVWVDSEEMLTVLKQHVSQACSVKLHVSPQNIFNAFNLDHSIGALLKRKLWLENGGFVVFDYGEALTSIDINTGKSTKNQSLQQTIMETNRLAAILICEQIKLRNLSGMILIDFVNMKSSRDKQEILELVKKECKKDPVRTVVVGFTELGVLQLTRKKTSISLQDAFTKECPTCIGYGRVYHEENIALKLERELWEYEQHDGEKITIQTTNGVHEYFSGKNSSHKERLERVLHKELVFRLVDQPVPFYEIVRVDS